MWVKGASGSNGTQLHAYLFQKVCWSLGNVAEISVIFKLILEIDILNISNEIVLEWMTQNSTDDQSNIVLGMAWWY